MIIVRTPLRISLGGGGTDLPSYYKEHGGFLISAAINKYIYITIHETFIDELIIKYSKLESVRTIEQIQHPIIKESLKLLNINNLSYEITSMADIPAGTGLGSSGSFTVALLHALHSLKHDIVTPKKLAEEACCIEIEKLNEPVGKQDQYIAAYGGITCFEFKKDDSVIVSPLHLTNETRYNLEDNLIMFFTGFSRKASAVLKEQDDKSKNNNHEMIKNLHYVKELGLKSKMALEKGDLKSFADYMNTHWEYKKQRSNSMSNNHINEWYDLALKNGALGGKLIGAGGGGFLMFYTEEKSKLRHTMNKLGLREVRFNFDREGSKLISS